MGFVAAGVCVVAFFAADRGRALWRRRTLDRRRAKAEYPDTENDPLGRTII